MGEGEGEREEIWREIQICYMREGGGRERGERERDKQREGK